MEPVAEARLFALLNGSLEREKERGSNNSMSLNGIRQLLIQVLMLCTVFAQEVQMKGSILAAQIDQEYRRKQWLKRKTRAKCIKENKQYKRVCEGKQ